jgi:hypothetical protein
LRQSTRHVPHADRQPAAHYLGSVIDLRATDRDHLDEIAGFTGSTSIALNI